LTLAVNLALALNVLFGNSMVSLLLLFVIFLVSVAAALNILYMTVNDNRKKANTIEMDYEEVTSEQILALIKPIYEGILTL
jgi:ABC-type multidrug transport system fused ATPase/permease subunit